MTTLFARFDEDRSTELKLHNDDVTWMDLSEEFFAFLQGCGYQMTREDFAEYWGQYAEPESEGVTASVTWPSSWGTLTPTMEGGTVTITTTETKTY